MAHKYFWPRKRLIDDLTRPKQAVSHPVSEKVAPKKKRKEKRKKIIKSEKQDRTKRRKRSLKEDIWHVITRKSAII